MQSDPRVMQSMDQLDKIVASWINSQKPMIKAVIRPWHRQWRVTLEEDTDHTSNIKIVASDLDTHVAWAIKQLENWPNVNRWSWQDWHFEKKSDAEKFVTLHTLKWAQ